MNTETNNTLNDILDSAIHDLPEGCQEQVKTMVEELDFEEASLSEEEFINRIEPILGVMHDGCMEEGEMMPAANFAMKLALYYGIKRNNR